MEVNRRKEVVNACLATLVSKGLFETTTRDLSEALQLQSGGLYYYFKSKDDAVLACAQEAMMRLESNLIIPALKELHNPDEMMRTLKKRADQMAPMMRFLTQVATSDRYKSDIKPLLDELSSRYKQYASRFAKEFNCQVDEIEPYVYMSITAVSNYMIFEEDAYIYPQTNLVKAKIKELLNR